MYYIYKIYNEGELIYVGKTNNFHTRINNHLHSQSWKEEITHIELAECITKIDMDIYEKYYINKIRPKYNLAMVYEESTTFKIQELAFKRFKLKEFIEFCRPKKEVIKANKDEKDIFRKTTTSFSLENDVVQKINKVKLDLGLSSRSIALERIVLSYGNSDAMDKDTLKKLIREVINENKDSRVTKKDAQSNIIKLIIEDAYNDMAN